MTIVRMREFRAAPGQEPALRAFLRTVVAPQIVVAAGCAGCQVLHDQDDPARFVVRETWASVDAHQAAAQAIPAALLTQIRPLLAEGPTGGYYTMC